MAEVRLKRTQEAAVIHGHPWVFSGAIESTSGDLGPGTATDVVSSRGR
jgi:23S rRNA G2069 N7-methylase RlmK/C1962 C5-methylase RlmI